MSIRCKDLMTVTFIIDQNFSLIQRGASGNCQRDQSAGITLYNHPDSAFHSVQ